MAKDKDKYTQVDPYTRKGPSGPVKVPGHIRRIKCSPKR